MASTIPKTIFIVVVLTLALTYTLALAVSSELNGTYTFGLRINNDRLLYRVENPYGNEEFLNFKFSGPDPGPGPDITCVEIAVSDIFNQTLVYISSGGIGEKSIVIVLAVLHKTQFSYTASIYGL